MVTAEDTDQTGGRILPRLMASELTGEALRESQQPSTMSTLLSTGGDDSEDEDQQIDQI